MPVDEGWKHITQTPKNMSGFLRMEAHGKAKTVIEYRSWILI